MIINGISISKAVLGNTPYFVIQIDGGEGFIQRRKRASPHDRPLEPHERVLVKICEHLLLTK